MIVVIGLGVSSLILSRIGWPHPGFFVSTTTTPLAVTNTAVLPPPAAGGDDLSTYRLSLSLSTVTTFGPCCCGGCALTAASAPSASSVPSTKLRLMKSLQERKPAE